jgi:uncharacterized membrane protein
MFMSATEYSSACNAAHKVSCFQTVQQYKAVQLYRLASDWQYILMHAAIDEVTPPHSFQKVKSYVKKGGSMFLKPQPYCCC